MDRKIASLLSLSQKAGKIATGEVACEKALQSGEAKLVLVAEDASDNTKKKFVNKSFFYEVPCHVMFDKAEISRVIGKENRAVLVVVDATFATKIEELI